MTGQQRHTGGGSTPPRRTALGRSVRAKAPGKINASFVVGPQRNDGYHGVASLYVAVSLYEEVTATITDSAEISVEISRASDGFDARGRSHWPSIPVNGENLAVKAAKLMADVSPNPTGLHLQITKRVPVAGGMGGGSADAAATLVACDALWGAGLSREELAHVGSELGADVPFSLFGGAAIGVGVGDELSPVLAPKTLNWVLVKSDYGLSTPTVYSTLDRIRAARGATVAEPGGVDPAILQALRNGDAQALAPLLHNDLQLAALSMAPGLHEVIDTGLTCGALAGLVSGSGPTVALLTSDAEHAEDVLEQLRDSGYQATAVHSPVHGAKVVAEVLG